MKTPTEAPRRERPVTHDQRVHCGQVPDISLGGGVGPGREPRLQPTHQRV